MALVSLVEWQKYLKCHPDAHILQSAEWGELKYSFGWDVLRLVSGNEGVQILFRRLPLGFSIAYAPKPDSGRYFLGISDKFQTEIDTACRSKRAIFLKIELDDWDTEKITRVPKLWKLVSSLYNIQPPRTIIVPLVGGEEDILAQMKQKCRYNLRLAEKKGVTVRAWDDVDGFYQLLRSTGKRDGFGVHSLAYYRKAYELFHPAGLAEMLLAEYGGQPLAALMVFANGERSWYLYGASNDQERSRMPAYLLQWRAIQWAISRGCKEYDLWGIPDEDEELLEAQFENRHDGLWGVYRFKRGFGGQVRRAVQAYDRVYMPWLYRLYLWRMGKTG